MDGKLLDMFCMDFVKLAKQIIPSKNKHRKDVIRLLRHAEDRTRLYPASTKYHHCWAGGLADHISQVMALMMIHRDAIPDVPLWQIPVAAYLHDWEKHWKYVPLLGSEELWHKHHPKMHPSNVAALTVGQPFRYIEIPGKFGPSTEIQTGILLERFNLPVSMSLSNALMLSEGGWSPHAKDFGLDKFATVLHTADMISSHCYQEFSGAGAARWSGKSHQDVVQAHSRVEPLGVGTWPR